MRIIGEFDHDAIKVTVFKMNEKISVKYEYNLMEQTYKFRDGSGIDTLEDVKRFSNDTVVAHIKSIFIDMEKAKLSGLKDSLSIDPMYSFEII